MNLEEVKRSELKDDVLGLCLDFVCAGTSADEGLGLCHAICEYLLNMKVCCTAYSRNTKQKVPCILLTYCTFTFVRLLLSLPPISWN